MAAAVKLSGLSLRFGQRVLLDRADAEFECGKITLIVGPSGSGKTTLLRAIAGLVQRDDSPPSQSGTIEMIPDARGRKPSVGIVFQHLALFDEWSPLENVRFAAAHRRTDASEGDGQPRTGSRSTGPTAAAASSSIETRPQLARRLLQQLGVPTDVRTNSLSGGQRRRLAVARTIAADPDVILYDEPTAGLDLATARKVAQFIRTVHDSSGKTTIIVTHDYEPLLAIADAVYLLDPHTAKLRPLPAADWPKLGELLEPVAERPAEPAARRRPLGLLRRTLSLLAAFCASTACTLELLAQLPLRLLPLWRSAAWGLRFALHYLRIVAGPSAVLYIAISGALAGFVATYFTFERMPYRHYTEPLVIEELLSGLGFSLYRVLIPVLVTLLVAARCGAAVTADISSKSYGRQLELMAMLGVPPRRYVLTACFWAFLIGMPLLVLVGFFAAKWTSLVVFVATHSQLGPEFWHLHFHQALIDPQSLGYRGSGWLLAKTLACGAGVAAICYERGSGPKQSPDDVNRSITTAILWTTLYVLTVHFVFAFFEFKAA